MADALASMDEGGYQLWREIIAFDLGLAELSDDVLDEQIIREILAEHGIESDEI